MRSLIILGLLTVAGDSRALKIDLLSLDIAKKDLGSQGWKGGDTSKAHTLIQEDGLVMIRSRYEPPKSADAIYHAVEWNVEDFPWFKWKWRVRKFPKNANIMDSNRSDAAAQIYILWGGMGRKGYVVKYFWSTTDSVGQELKQSRFLAGSLWGIVLEKMGTVGEWKTETRNVLQDFEKAFGQKPPGKVYAVGLLSDGDATLTESEADYASFEALTSRDEAIPVTTSLTDPLNPVMVPRK